ncbi:MAG: class I SAM-dependent methyltransferase [Actinomycetota bacterium]
MTDRASTSLFDRWSRTYDSTTLQRLTYRPVHDAVLRRLGVIRPTVVLDLGCGTGQLTERLVDELPQSKVIGLDLSAGMLRRADARLGASGATSLLRADAMHLPFSDDTFDAVVCTESFHWYPDQQQVLAGLADVVRPGGRVVIVSVAAVTDAGDRMLRMATSAGGNTIRALAPRRLRNVLARSGFEVIAQRRIPRVGLVPWPVLTEARLGASVLRDTVVRPSEKFSA